MSILTSAQFGEEMMVLSTTSAGKLSDFCNLALQTLLVIVTVVGGSHAFEGVFAQAATGEIVGDVRADDGSPVRGAEVRLSANSIGFFRSARVDTRGRFRFEDIPQGQYELRASAAGYYQPGTGSIVKPGETAHLLLSKGAVVSGKVVDEKGNPLVDIVVRLTPVNRTQPNRVESLLGGVRTDDRGIYRVYGVRPWTYVVSAGGHAIAGNNAGADAYQHEAASYHPSGGRENASELSVRAGEELLDINIVHRGQIGHRVSGTVTGFSDVGNVFPSVTLLNVATRVQSLSNRPVRSADGQFEFYSLPDGVYELFARLPTATTGLTTSTAAFASTRISVKGSDVTGLHLDLLPLGVISGSIELGTLSSAPSCKSTEALSPGQVNLALVPSEWARQEIPPPLVPSPERVTADENWQFRIRSVLAGSYRPFAFLTVSNWYVDYMTTAVKGPVRTGNMKKSSDAMDFTLNGITVGVGGNVSGLRIGIAHGGAEIQGRVISGEPLPSYSMRVYALPTEDTTNPLRYYEAFVGQNGEFTMRGIKPGVYRLAAMKTRENDTEAQALPVSLMSPAERSKLRQGAEKGLRIIELQPCQRLENIVIDY